MNVSLGHFYTISPLARFGLTSEFFQLNIDTIGFTWLAMALLFVGAFFVRRLIQNEQSLTFIALEKVADSFAGLCAQTVGYVRIDYFCYMVTLFMFTIATCLVGLFPYVEEAARDVNTTTALSLVSFFYIAFQSISQEGVLTYMSHYMGPKEVPFIVRIFMSPLETMGQISKVISMSFRLFGNVMGGGVVFQVIVGLLLAVKEYFVVASVVAALVWLVVFKLLETASDEGAGFYINIGLQAFFLITWAQLFFGVFEALIQAFVIAMLSMTYLSMTVHHNLKEDRKAILWT